MKMGLDETVFLLTRPEDEDFIEAIGVPLDFTQDLVGLYFGYKNNVAPSIFLAHMLKTFGEAKFLDLGDCFQYGFVTNMRIINPRFSILDEANENYSKIRAELLSIRADQRPKACLELHYDSKNKFWLYEPIQPEIPMNSSFVYF